MNPLQPNHGEGGDGKTAGRSRLSRDMMNTDFRSSNPGRTMATQQHNPALFQFQGLRGFPTTNAAIQFLPDLSSLPPYPTAIAVPSEVSRTPDRSRRLPDLNAARQHMFRPDYHMTHYGRRPVTFISSQPRASVPSSQGQLLTNSESTVHPPQILGTQTTTTPLTTTVPPSPGYSLARSDTLPTPPQDLTVSVPPMRPDNPIEPKVEAPPTQKTCGLCMEQLDDNLVNFPYQCHKCHAGLYCIGCIKEWFLDASINEYKMPPKCCTPIPLSTVKKIISTEQAEVYKMKFIERDTRDRLYCPIPFCSTFIPPRLISKLKKASKASKVSDVSDVSADTGDPMELDSHPLEDFKLKVTCPKCLVLICTHCRSLNHDGACVTEDIDHDLAAQLEKWKIKRCPKCRAGVRKMYGCNHVECRCGAHFCWECLMPASDCDGSCEEEEDSDFAADDIDGNEHHFDGDGVEFGPEPDNHTPSGFNCEHDWTSPDSLHKDTECYSCFETVTMPKDCPERRIKRLKKTPSRLENIVKSCPTDPMDMPWKCFGGHMTCGSCSKKVPDHRSDDTSWMWNCNCSMICFQCNRVEATEQFFKDKQAAKTEGRRAWVCSFCERVLCGACKADEE